MARWVLNDEEADALFGLPHLSQVLYVLVLRRHMDFASGIVGRKGWVSVQKLREWTELRPDRGSRASPRQATPQELRTAIDALIRRGLLVRLGDLVFRLPLADVGAQKTRSVGPSGSGASKKGALEERNDERNDERNVSSNAEQQVICDERNDERNCCSAMNVTHLESGKDSLGARAREAEGGQPVSLAAARLSVVLRENGVMSSPSNPVLIEAARQGVEEATLRAACDEATRSTKGGPVSLGYVMGIVRRWAREARELDVRGAGASQRVRYPRTDAEWTDAGRRLGQPARAGEGWEAYRQRIREALDRESRGDGGAADGA